MAVPSSLSSPVFIYIYIIYGPSHLSSGRLCPLCVQQLILSLFQVTPTSVTLAPSQLPYYKLLSVPFLYMVYFLLYIALRNDACHMIGKGGKIRLGRGWGYTGHFLSHIQMAVFELRV